MSTSTTVGIVASFNPGPDLALTLQSAIQQLAAIVIVDDGSTSAKSKSEIRAAAAMGCTVLQLPHNVGIAAALNRGISVALKVPNVRYILTLDQDTEIAPDYIDKAMVEFASLALMGETPASLIAGRINSQNPSSFAVSAKPFRTLEGLQSGAIFPIETFLDARFNEDLFIDCVETEFFLRQARRGKYTYKCSSMAIKHALGTDAKIKLPWRSHITTFALHSATRQYYIVRNRTYILKRYGLRWPRWAVSSGVSELRVLMLNLIRSTDRVGIARATVVGLFHGITNKLGKIPIWVTKGAGA